MVYVTMTDTALSGWGMAEGKTNKYVIECETLEEARIVERNARRRSEMKYINLNYTMPYYNPKKYLVSVESYKDLGEIWKRG